MKKKTRVTASGTAKRRKSGAQGAQMQPRRGSRAEAAAGASRQPTAPDGAKPAIRRLRAQLARALARIDELQALRRYRFSAGNSQPARL